MNNAVKQYNKLINSIKVMLCLVLVVGMFPTLALTAMAENAYAATLPTKIVNGDFSYPAKSQIQHYVDIDLNDIYVDPTGKTLFTTIWVGADYQGKWYPIKNFQSSKLGWRSTEPAGQVSNFTYPDGTFQINFDDVTYNAFAEVVASSSNDAIYQDIATTPGAVYKWQLKHCSFKCEYDDSMQVRIGSQTSQSPQQATRLKANGYGDRTGVVGTTIKTHNAPTTKDIFGAYSNSWETYTGGYKVPSGQTVTRFTFKSLDAIDETAGNNLDDISFEIAYPLNYDLNGGSSTSSVFNPDSNNYAGYYTAGQSATLTSVKPERTGFTFLGWSAERIEDVYGKEAFDTARSQLITSAIMASPSKTVYAVWAKNPIVTFKSGHDGNDVLASNEVVIGQGANEPVQPRWTGHTFTNWDAAFDSVWEDITVTAQWRLNTYNIVYDANGGTGETGGVTVTYGEAATIAENGFIYEDHTFRHWNTEPDGTGRRLNEGDSVVNLTDEDAVTVTLYAQWEFQPTVTYVDGWGETLKTETIPYGHGSKTPPDPEHPGYTFTDWSDDVTEVYTDKIVTALWEANEATILFDANGGTGEMDPLTLKYDEPATLPENGFKNTGHTFVSWNTEPDGTGVTYSDKDSILNISDKDGYMMVLYAQWKVHRYTIEYDANGGQGIMQPQEAIYDETLELSKNTFKKPGSLFLGWSVKPNGSIAYEDQAFVRNLTDKVDGTVELYAVWEDNAKVRITYEPADPDKGSVSVPYEEIMSSTGTPKGSLAKPDRGYKFSKWVLADGTSASESIHMIPSKSREGIYEPVTYYAEVFPISYHIAFDPQGGDGSIPRMDVTYNDIAELPQDGFEKPGAILTGFSKEPGGGGEVFPLGAKISNLTDKDGETVTLYAVWEKGAYKIEYDANGGEGSMANQVVRCEDSVRLLSNNYQMRDAAWCGWNTETDGTGTDFKNKEKVQSLAEEGDTIVMYAMWADGENEGGTDSDGQPGDTNEGNDPERPTLPAIDNTNDSDHDKDGNHPDTKPETSTGSDRDSDNSLDNSDHLPSKVPFHYPNALSGNNVADNQGSATASNQEGSTVQASLNDTLGTGYAKTSDEIADKLWIAAVLAVCVIGSLAFGIASLVKRKKKS